MFSIGQNFTNVFFSPINWIIDNFIYIKIISVVSSIILIVFIVKYIIKSEYFSEMMEFNLKHAINYSKFDNNNTQKIWNLILEMVSTSNPEKWKKSVIIADELLMETLRRAGYKGDRMNYILSNISEEKIQGINEFKKFRSDMFENLLDESYIPELDMVKKILKKYRDLLQFFGVIK